MTVQACLCRTLSETQIVGFSHAASRMEVSWSAAMQWLASCQNLVFANGNLKANFIQYKKNASVGSKVEHS